MAIVIHTRKGKYQYAYEHTREGDKVISRYMYPVNAKGYQVKAYQKEVVQQTETEHKEVAQHREIIIGKPTTYAGTKEIEVEYDPFLNGDFKPVSTRYIIKKYKEEKEWHVYKKGEYTGGKDGYKKKDTYIGTDTLKNCKKYCIKKLEKLKK